MVQSKGFPAHRQVPSRTAQWLLSRLEAVRKPTKGSKKASNSPRRAPNSSRKTITKQHRPRQENRTTRKIVKTLRELWEQE